MIDNTLGDGLTRALHSFSGARERWEKRRRKGLNDEELVEAIGREFGIMGGVGIPDGVDISFKGGPTPAFWIGATVPLGKPTLTGRRLLEAVRQVMGIPFPGAGFQGRLF